MKIAQGDRKFIAGLKMKECQSPAGAKEIWKQKQFDFCRPSGDYLTSSLAPTDKGRVAQIPNDEKAE